MWRRPRSCESRAREFSEPDRFYEPCAAYQPRAPNEFCGSNEFCDSDEFCNPDEFNDADDSHDPHQPGCSRQRRLTTSCTKRSTWAAQLAKLMLPT